MSCRSGDGGDREHVTLETLVCVKDGKGVRQMFVRNIKVQAHNTVNNACLPDYLRLRGSVYY